MVRTAFQNNFIPANRFSAVSKAILPLIPDPTGSGLSSNYATSTIATIKKNIYSLKLDHQFPERNRISGLYSWQRQTNLSQTGLPGPLAAGNVSTERPDITRLNHDFTFSPTMLNHATFGLSRYQSLFNQLPQHLQDWANKLGLKGVETGEFQSFPIVTFTDSLTGFGNNPKTQGAQQNWTYEFHDGLTWLKGKHEFKMGYEWHRGRTFQRPLDYSYGQGLFNLNSLQTANPQARTTTGYSFASFLLGAPNDARRDYYTKGVDIKYIYHGLYFNDTYKVTSN